MRKWLKRWLRHVTPDHAAIESNRWLYPFRNSLLHPRLWHMNRHSVAGGVAAGIFFGLMPPPFQMLGATLTAVVCRFNWPIAVLTTFYSNPFTVLPLYWLAWWIGRLILGSEAAFVPPPPFDVHDIQASLTATFDWLKHLGMTLVVGVFLLALILAVLGYFGVRAIWRVWLVRTWHRRRLHRANASITQ